MAQLSCPFATYSGSKCDFSSRWPWRQQLIPLNSCADSVKEHLRGVKVSQTCVASEKELILARAGLFGDSNGRDFTICPQHRAELGARFKPSIKCQHPLHGNRRGKVERGVNLKMAKKKSKQSGRLLFHLVQVILDCILCTDKSSLIVN